MGLWCWLGFVLASPAHAQLIPAPQKITSQAGELRLEKVVSIALINDILEESATTAAEVVNEAFMDFLQIRTVFETSPSRATIHLIRITEEQALKYLIPLSKIKEGYRLRIDKERITIESTHPQGLFYGANTLAQIIAQSTKKNLACTEIVDWANFDYRGISDDISRGQMHTFQQYKKVIRELARYKQNTLMMYIEDALELNNYSEIGSGRPRLTQKEVRDLVTYAGKYFIQITPIIETLGHQENILAVKGFQHLAEFSGAMSFCVTEPRVYEYLDNVIGEVAKIFPSPYIHIGGDESFDVGVGRSKALAQQMGLPALHLQHYKKVADICRKYKKQPVIYGDMLLKYPDILPKLDANFTLMDWQYGVENDYPSTAQMQASKLDYWVSPTVHNFRQILPQTNKALQNIQQLAQAGKTRGAKGLITSNWGDMGNESPKDLLHFLYAFNGACAWNVEGTQASEVQKPFFRYFFRTSKGLANDIYTLFMNPDLEVSWKEFWRHPLLPTKASQADILSKKMNIEIQTNTILRHIDSLRRQVKVNLQTIESWEITASMLRFYAHKLDLQERLKTFSQLNAKDKEKVVEDLLKDLEAMPADIQAIQAKYEKFWKKHYKPEGLIPIQLKFSNLTAAFQDTKDLILGGQESFDVRTLSKWIYPPTDQPATEVVFYRDILLNDLPIIANMQIIADCFAEVYINGALVDSVYTRNIFSAHLEPKVVKWIDFKDKIGDDPNEPVRIMIKARNYNEGLRQLLPKANINPSAGINVVIRIQDTETENLTYSDELWQCTIGDQDKTPKRVSIQPYRYEVIMPNLQQNRPSWIER